MNRSEAKKLAPQPANASLLITVTICTRNRADFLEQAVRSVLPQLAGDTELLVVDNASTDETRRVCGRLAEESGAFGYFYEPKLGLSVARNLALNHARGKYVLFLDDDAVAEPGWLEAYRQFLAQPPAAKIAVVGGAVIPIYDRRPPKWISPDHGRFGFGEESLRLPGGGLSGCNSAYCREAVMTAGRFDERLGYQGNILIPREESELQDRLIKAGGECWWLAGAPVRHFMAADRLTLRHTASSAFHAGRAAAIHRLKTMTTRQHRWELRLGRLLISPFYIAINLFAFLFLFPFGKPVTAVGALSRAMRMAGWVWQIFKSPNP